MILVTTVNKEKFWTDQIEETPEFFVFDRKLKSGKVLKIKLSKQQVVAIVDGLDSKS